MIQQEKMATLGLLIAGISHEINTPLGAINASCKTLVDTINKDIISELNDLDYTDYKSSISLLSLVSHDRKYLTTREERELLSSMSKQLNEKAPFVSEINFYVRKLLEMGFSDIDIRLISFLELPNSRNIFSIASGFARLNRVLDTISIATNRATKVVKTLNNYSHGNLNGILTTFNLKESIENTISLLNNKIKNGSSVFVNIHENVFITGNQEELSQIWNKCTIKIDYLLIENTNHRIIISNNGPAIPKELLSKIFDPFFTTKKLGQGSGIGLDIVKKIIEKHSGKINVESDENETAFEITIPLKLLKDE
jgi:signal transduction histidine kinase